MKGLNRCRGCRARIVWARTSNVRFMPIDPDPHPDGNCRLSDGDVVVLAGQQLETARAAREPLHLSHFATCPAVAARRARRSIDDRTGNPIVQEPLL